MPVTDVAKCLQAVDPQKAMGSDTLPGIILQRFAHILAPNLTKIINRSLTTGKVPDTFKISHVSPLFKSGDPSIPKKLSSCVTSSDHLPNLRGHGEKTGHGLSR